jgi:hypothetical protein
MRPIFKEKKETGQHIEIIFLHVKARAYTAKFTAKIYMST